MIITTERLQYLWAVAESGSFSAAGRKLGYSAAAVQQAIQAFEFDLEATLFDRQPGKKPTLTKLGQHLYLQALEVLPKLEGMEKFAQAISDGQEPQLRLALHGMTLFPKYQQVLLELQQAFPTLDLLLLDADDAVLSCDKARIANHPSSPLADIILSPGRLRKDHGGNEKIIDRIQWRIVAASKHPLSKRRGVLGQEDLDQYAQLYPVPGIIFTKELTEGIRLSSRLIQYSRFYQLKEFLLAGLGFAVFPARLAQPYVDSGELKCLSLDFDDGEINWGVELAWAPNLGAAGRWLVDKLSELPKG
ncbi:LysR family transcriptional regulator [Paraferrimonas sedimenticola]|uniref:LysR family transcriptional regulator n=1 Tax=Paraferrimonas sedimenticola TaxID=375674 RepID=A0AA37VTN4_9GAMM|nr:LysR family transcriptional regulator [Paraferrimonas sedimenticola]GLP95439.1 LysR family transcriptional regulator [Paraferrimonas sedimenticola]